MIDVHSFPEPDLLPSSVKSVIMKHVLLIPLHGLVVFYEHFITYM